VVPGLSEPQWLVLTDPEIPQGGLDISWVFPQPEGSTHADYRRSLAEGLFQGAMNERLGELARRDDTPLLGAGAGRSRLTAASRMDSVGVAPKEGREIEAYELIDFLTGPEASGDTPAAAHRDGGRVLYDPNASVLDLVQRAVDEAFDLRIDYFSRRRGEMNTRRITPREIKAETYVMAFCHARQSERVFRISRITRCVPIDGKPDRPSAPQRALQHESEPGPAQLSLLDDETVSGD
jgi:hypothetical protein